MRLTDRAAPGSRWLRLYPRGWRERYEIEMLAVLEARPMDWRTRFDLAGGALDAHIHPLTAPSIPIVAAAIAGIAWLLVGLTSALQPIVPDWPGFLLESLPLGVVGATAALAVTLAVGRRSGLTVGGGNDLALGWATAGHVLWIGMLAIATLGGPYGAITGAGQAVAAAGTVALGLVRWRADDHPLAEAMLVGGAALLIPSPLAWVAAGAVWIALAVFAMLSPAGPVRTA
ncbi:MAG: hypothetical protein M3P84_11975 [Chloroflexota bacterium]|nr:hypothetical protein [Chloroflexota bacterium]